MASLGLVILLLNLALQSEAISRYNYGVLINEEFTFLNSHSYWEHVYVLNITDLIGQDLPTDFSPGICTGFKEDVSSKMYCNVLSDSFQANSHLSTQLYIKLIENESTIKKLLDMNPSRDKRGILDFVGKLGKDLFGLSTESDDRNLRHLIELYNQKMINRTNQLEHLDEQMFSHQTLMNSRITNLKQALFYTSSLANNTVNTVNHLISVTNKHTKDIQNNTRDIDVLRQMTNVLHTNTLLDVIGPVIELEQSSVNVESLNLLFNNKLPPNLIKPEHVTNMLEYIEGQLSKNYSTYSITFHHPNYYYMSNDVHAFVLDQKLFVKIRVPLHNYNTKFQVYHINTVPIHLTPQSKLLSQIINVSPYLAISEDGQYYFHMTEMDVLNCKNDGMSKCNKLFPMIPREKPSCASALYFDQAEIISNICQMTIIQNTTASNGIHYVANNSFFVGFDSEDTWVETCPKKPPRNIPACSLCLITPNMGCSVQSKNFYIPGSMIISDDHPTRVHTVNLMIIHSFLNIKQYSITANQTFKNPVNVQIPHINVPSDFMEHTTKVDSGIELDMKKTSKMIHNNQKLFYSSSNYVFDQLQWAMDPMLQHSLSVLPGMNMFMNVLELGLVSYCMYKIHKYLPTAKIVHTVSSAALTPPPWIPDNYDRTLPPWKGEYDYNMANPFEDYESSTAKTVETTESHSNLVKREYPDNPFELPAFKDVMKQAGDMAIALQGKYGPILRSTNTPPTEESFLAEHFEKICWMVVSGFCLTIIFIYLITKLIETIGECRRISNNWAFLHVTGSGKCMHIPFMKLKDCPLRYRFRIKDHNLGKIKIIAIEGVFAPTVLMEWGLFHGHYKTLIVPNRKLRIPMYAKARLQEIIRKDYTIKVVLSHNNKIYNPASCNCGSPISGPITPQVQPKTNPNQGHSNETTPKQNMMALPPPDAIPKPNTGTLIDPRANQNYDQNTNEQNFYEPVGAHGAANFDDQAQIDNNINENSGLLSESGTYPSAPQQY